MKFIRLENFIHVIEIHSNDDLSLLKDNFKGDLYFRNIDKQIFIRRTESNLRKISLLQQQSITEVSKGVKAKKVKDELIKSRSEAIRSRSSYNLQAATIKKKLRDKQTIDYDGSCQKLMNHQKAACQLGHLFDKYAFFYDTGTGKTVVALEIINQKFIKQTARFLIICPKTIIKSAWMSDSRRFFPDLRIMPLHSGMTYSDYLHLMQQWDIDGMGSGIISGKYYSGTKRECMIRMKYALIQKAQHFIINPEMFRNNPESYMSIVNGHDTIELSGIIFDESALLRNPDSATTKSVKDASKKAQYLYLLSGKPAPNRIMEYYPQMQLIIPEILFDSYKSMNDMINNSPLSQYNHSSIVDYSQFDLKPTINSQQLLDFIDMGSITVSKEECIDLPEKTYQVRDIALDAQGRNEYLSMKNSLRAQFAEDEKLPIYKNKTIYANHILTCLSKLRQLASGFIIDDQRTPHKIHDCKTDELFRIIEELGDNQAIIWCQYHYEIELITNLLIKDHYTVVTAYGKTQDKDDSIEKFKSGKAQFIVAHPKTLRYGVTLVNCTYAIYYSISYSYEEYYQSHDRIYRQGQSKPCTYIFIQAESTIDTIMFSAIQRKQTTTQFIESVLKNLAQVNDL